MSFETYKLKSTAKKNGSRLYTLDELRGMTLPALRAVCRDERIIPESLDVFNDKNETVELIFKCRGAASSPYINSFEPEGIARLKSLLDTYSEKLEDVEVSVPPRFDVYKGVDSLNDRGGEYAVLSESDIGGTNALLVDQKNNIFGIIHVSESRGANKNRYMLALRRHMWDAALKTGPHKDFSLLFFPNGFTRDNSEAVLKEYNKAARKASRVSFIRSPIPEFYAHEITDTDDALVIDYGTSFTTAGEYVDDGKIKLVRFHSEKPCEKDPLTPAYLASCEECGRCYLCPSAVAVTKIDENRVTFAYGEAARDRLPMARNSVFYDTKRWVNNYTEKISVKDFDGDSISLSRSVIIEKFLNHVIDQAEQQNKKRYRNIRFTAPVKQKALSARMYKDVLTGYNVVVKDTIDEAVAVVFGLRAEDVRDFKYESGVKKNVLLIDCGGGTSDMVKCDYVITKAESRSDIEMRVGYANGDTNFGGNNLTYRIMQYLKIKLAAYYSGEKSPDAGELLGVTSADIYDYVDKSGLKSLYERFDGQYAKAGEIIPTDFDRYKNEAEFIFLDVRGNFYFLWNLAERIKVEFYNNVSSYEFNFERLKRPGNWGGYALAARRSRTGELDTYTLCPPVTVSRDEVNMLLKPEIYGLLKNFVEKRYLDGTLREVNRIQLSGQTTKVDIFRDVLKEYIEGRKARAPFESGYHRKLLCVNGAIAYHGAIIAGKIRADIKYEPAAVPYALTAETFNPDEPEKTLIACGQSLEDVYGYVDRTPETEFIIFELKNREGRVLHQIRADVSVPGYKRAEIKELLDEFKMFEQGDIDRITDDKPRIFVFSDDDSWGFKVLGISRNGGYLSKGEVTYFPFENTEWEMDFFDGRK